MCISLMVGYVACLLTCGSTVPSEQEFCGGEVWGGGDIVPRTADQAPDSRLWWPLWERGGSRMPSPSPEGALLGLATCLSAPSPLPLPWDCVPATLGCSQRSRADLGSIEASASLWVSLQDCWSLVRLLLPGTWEDHTAPLPVG